MRNNDVLELLCTASVALREAEDALSKIVDNGRYCAPDAEYYLHEIKALISCDDGDAGLDTLIDIVKKEVEK